MLPPLAKEEMMPVHRGGLVGNMELVWGKAKEKGGDKPVEGNSPDRIDNLSISPALLWLPLMRPAA